MDAQSISNGQRAVALVATVVISLGAAGLAGPIQAQEQAQQATDEVVLVTGSRIARRDFTAPSPIMTVDREAFNQTATVSIESVLNQFPQFVPTGTQFVTGNIEPSAFENPGISNVNLRGLGSNRNLVLVDGRRMQPTNALLVVDVGTIPQAAIARVEAITGGASAVYGADAISGVVNFVLRDNFEGIDIDLQTGVSAEGDGEESRLSMLIGGNFGGDRGNVMFGAEWSERQTIFNVDRDFIVAGWRDPGSSTGTGNVAATYWNPPSCVGPGAVGCPSQAAVDQVFGQAGVPRGNDMYIDDDGTIFQRQGAVGYNGPLGGDSWRKISIYNNDTLSQVNPTTLLSSPQTRYALFGRAHYDIAGDVRAFVQGTFSQVEVDSWGPLALAIAGSAASIPHGTDVYAPSVGPGGVTNADYVAGGAVGLNCPAMGGCTNSQAFPVPTDLATLLDSRGTPNANWALERYLDFFPTLRQTNNETTVYQIQAGVEGTLPERDWTWEAYVSHGETSIDSYLSGGWLSQNRWFALAQSPNYGRMASFGGIGTSGFCTTGLPLLEDFQMSQDCLDFMEAHAKQITRIDQTVIEANMQGGIVDMPAGQLRFALGVSSRKNEALFEPDTLINSNSTTDTLVGLFPMASTQGEDEVSEIYGELLIPAVQRLSFELGYRYSDYDREGGVDTYKALFDWGATDWLRFRGGRQIANRAPNIAEQFTGPSSNVVGFPGSDPCASDTTNEWGNTPSNPDRAQVQALCSAIIGNPSSVWDQDPDNFVGPFGFFQLEVEQVVGNPNVKSEEAETYTLGAVIEREGWSLSVDYYTIDIAGAIEPPSAFIAYSQCFNANGTNPSYSIDDPGGFCRNIVRDPVSGWREQVTALYTNLGALETEGVDTQFNWRGDIGANSLGLSVIINMLNSYELQPVPGGQIFDYAGTLGQGGQYDYRTYTTLSYAMSSVNLGLRWIHLPSIKDASYAENPGTSVQPADAYDRFDFFGSWRMGSRDSMELRFGVNNVLDSDPSIVGYEPGVNNALGSTNPSYYDVIGRHYYTGLRFSF